MTNSKTSSTRPSKIIPNWVIFALIAVSLIGLADSSYLAAKHYLGSPINCSIFNGCEVVTTSPYSVILGVPVALFGVLYYFSFLLLTILYLDSKNEKTLEFAARFSIVGVAASIWFLFLQIFIIKALCLYCLISTTTSATLFVLGLIVLKRKNVSFFQDNLRDYFRIS
ncbi:MAG: hypothetical protein UU54_C0004G0023 [Candidatus Yanofskybacteria bacterium GW2011_GWA2_41_22]|uniref:Vitamin K epoxide reductase domain-containing protein n=3 Tax=Candidatus Yanofskyibacteriota TaxID=1752733 RepID=A0A1F8HX34_9BACT|nr:MAG: hypothetical protein UU54_C0004G0023 [Candidatus Yanofskybacteria bacterium GW2011_GWA2_41_22]OGM98687.1 MAG: hypothetical protein A2736_00470 [Candidatus Yanofskybacteria bacterium RIFCSPHIGHO2_01_FULL_41_27]OGN21217.1 MAG: hypothetical protein A3B00_02425 [Candidatus Yanofskybacteria bacterium RIFCSPLOWO2_01_FULL_41_33]OGN41689.1 MAG: hypothetical protein A2606_02930 [Candidatus Yanofskybacteria bacterium RIFOXYD1_FULL_42_10]